MKIRKIERYDSIFDITSLVGYINTSYYQLVKKLGPPSTKGDHYKVDAEWLLIIDDMPVTIYNYKTGMNYLGDRGKSVNEIRDWHIGSRSKKAVKLIKKIFPKENVYEA